MNLILILLLNIILLSLLSDAVYDVMESGKDWSKEEMARMVILIFMELGVILYLLQAELTKTHANLFIVLYALSAITIPAWKVIQEDLEEDTAQILQWLYIGLLLLGSSVYLFLKNQGVERSRRVLSSARQSCEELGTCALDYGRQYARRVQGQPRARGRPSGQRRAPVAYRR